MMEINKRAVLCEAILKKTGKLPQECNLWTDDGLYDWCREEHPEIYNKLIGGD